MKYCFGLFSILLIQSLCIAQQQYIGIKTSLGLNNVSSNGSFKNSQINPTFYGSITYQYSFKKQYFLGVDLMYQKLGFVEPFSILNNFGKPTGESGEIIYNFNYLSFPISIGYNKGVKWNKTISVALIPGVLIGANMQVPAYKTNGKQKPEQRFDVSNQPNTFDFSAQINLGIGKNINTKINVYGLLGFQKSFTTFSNDNYFLNTNLKHYSISFSVGMNYIYTKN